MAPKSFAPYSPSGGGGFGVACILAGWEGSLGDDTLGISTFQEDPQRGPQQSASPGGATGKGRGEHSPQGVAPEKSSLEPLSPCFVPSQDNLETVTP
ncbi:hypothetical protein FKM82_012687 [Ascaphus truei]